MLTATGRSRHAGEEPFSRLDTLAKFERDEAGGLIALEELQVMNEQQKENSVYIPDGSTRG